MTIALGVAYAVFGGIYILIRLWSIGAKLQVDAETDLDHWRSSFLVGWEWTRDRWAGGNEPIAMLALALALMFWPVSLFFTVAETLFLVWRDR